MQNIIVAKRYAKALLEVANEDKTLVRIESDFRSVMRLIDKYVTHNSLMLNSVVPKSIRLSLFDDAIQKLDLHHFIRNFMHLLLYNNRIILIKLIFEQFQHLLDIQNNVKAVIVKTAYKLTEKARNSLEQGLEGRLKSKVKIENIVDSSIIGGMIVEVDSKLLDASIATKLRKIKKTAEV